jgi:hypothetical protein
MNTDELAADLPDRVNDYAFHLMFLELLAVADDKRDAMQEP